MTDHTCVTCPPGTINDAGDQAGGPDTSCDHIICQTGMHVVASGDGGFECAHCTNQKTNLPGDDASLGLSYCDPYPLVDASVTLSDVTAGAAGTTATVTFKTHSSMFAAGNSSFHVRWPASYSTAGVNVVATGGATTVTGPVTSTGGPVVTSWHSGATESLAG